MTTMTLKISDTSVLESLKQIFSRIAGIEIAEGKGTVVTLENLWKFCPPEKECL